MDWVCNDAYGRRSVAFVGPFQLPCRGVGRLRRVLVRRNAEGARASPCRRNYNMRIFASVDGYSTNIGLLAPRAGVPGTGLPRCKPHLSARSQIYTQTCTVVAFKCIRLRAGACCERAEARKPQPQPCGTLFH